MVELISVVQLFRIEKIGFWDNNGKMNLCLFNRVVCDMQNKKIQNEIIFNI